MNICEQQFREGAASEPASAFSPPVNSTTLRWPTQFNWRLGVETFKNRRSLRSNAVP